MEYEHETEPDDIVHEDSWSLMRALWRALWFVATIVIWSAIGLFFAAEYNNWQHSKDPIVIYELSESETSCSGMREVPTYPEPPVSRRDM